MTMQVFPDRARRHLSLKYLAKQSSNIKSNWFVQVKYLTNNIKSSQNAGILQYSTTLHKILPFTRQDAMN